MDQPVNIYFPKAVKHLNAPLQPPADETTQASRSQTMLMKDKLRRVGCKRLFGGALQKRASF
jgi:hypothetical protein